ncbi:MAG TPA: hypothetical protein VEP90_28530 [Methylomirabilota bacterium]|nr:hypothetical protein [Methylomirabilota bacterium]
MPDELIPDWLIPPEEAPFSFVRNVWNNTAYCFDGIYLSSATPSSQSPVVTTIINDSIRRELNMSTATVSRKKPLVIPDKDGKSIELAEDMLVMHETGCCHHTLSRVIRITPGRSIREHLVVIKPIHSREEHTVYLKHLTFVAGKQEEKTKVLHCEEEEKEKVLSLIERTENFHKNMYRALQRVDNYNSKSDYRLLRNLYDIVTLACVPSQHRWFWSTVAESLDDPRKVSYATNMELSDDNKRRRKCGIAGFLKKQTIEEHGFSFTKEEANRLGY